MPTSETCNRTQDFTKITLRTMTVKRIRIVRAKEASQPLITKKTKTTFTMSMKMIPIKKMITHAQQSQ